VTVSGRPEPAPAAGRSPLRRLVRRLVAGDQQLEAERLRQSAVRSGSELVTQCQRGQMVRLTGRLRTVVYRPRTNLPTLEAELYDGSGTVNLVWLGRRRIVGVEPGRALTVRGRLAVRDGRRVIYNPYYELLTSASGDQV
jgi:hypothetical protein